MKRYSTLKLIVISTSLCLLFSDLKAQTNSALQNYLDANSALKDNQSISKVELDLVNKLKSEKFGLSLEDVKNSFQDLNKEINKFKVKIEAKGDTAIIVKVLNADTVYKSEVIKIKEKNTSISFQTINNKVVEFISKSTFRTSDSPIRAMLTNVKNTEITNYLASEMLLLFDLKKENSTKEVFDFKKSKKNCDDFEKQYSKIINEFLKIQIVLDGEPKNDSKIIADYLNKKVNEVMSQFQQKSDNFFTQCIEQIDKLEERANSVLIGANMGLGVSNQQTGLGGGLSLLLKPKGGKFKVAVFASGLGTINSNDTALSKPFNFGVGVSGILFKNIQLQLMGSYVMDNLKTGTIAKYDRNLSKWVTDNNDLHKPSWEIAGGLQFKSTNGGFIIGVNGVYQYYAKDILLENDIYSYTTNQFCIGASFQTTDENSPIILVGIAGKDVKGPNKKISPTFQIVYPMVLNK